MYDPMKPASQGPQVTTRYRLSDFNVLAVFADMDEARAAIEALGRAGIEGQHVTLQGEAADELAQRFDTAAADERVLTHEFNTVAAWSIGGAAIGAVFGIPVGYALTGNLSLGTAIVSAFIGGLFISIIGALVGSMFRVYDSEAWELAFHAPGGRRTIVGVHSGDAADVMRAREILRGRGALRVHTASPYERPAEALRTAVRRG